MAITIREATHNAIEAFRTFTRWVTDTTAGYINSTFIVNGVETTYSIPNNKKILEENEEWKNNFLSSGAVITGTSVGDIGSVYKYFTMDNNNNNLHFVTNIFHTSHTQFVFHFRGMFLNQPLAVNFTVMGYMYADNGLVHVNFSDDTDNLFSVYVNSEGYVTIKYTGNHYYASLRIENIVVGTSPARAITEVRIQEEDI